MGEVNGADQDSLAKVGYNAVLCLCWFLAEEYALTVDYNMGQNSQ